MTGGFAHNVLTQCVNDNWNYNSHFNLWFVHYTVLTTILIKKGDVPNIGEKYNR